MPPTEIVADDSAIGVRCNDVFHFYVQDPDVDGLAAKIVGNGGKQRMPIREYYPGEKPYHMVYCENPFENLIEIYSHSYELTYSAGTYMK